MKQISPLLLVDFYKQSHVHMYPEGLQLLFSNFTPRKTRMKGVNYMVHFGMQYFVKEYLIDQWNKNFFERPKDEVMNEFKNFMEKTLGPLPSYDHIEKLHDLGYLPLSIWALPEGTRVPMRVPSFVIYNTHKDFAWMTNFLETLTSNVLWSMCTTATIADQYKKLFSAAALETTGSPFCNFQAHDFAMRGYSSVETTGTSGAGHLLSFMGTDSIPAIQFLRDYYGADMDKELIGTSVPATEHSVMTSYGKEKEIDAFERLLTLYPSGILSIVSDSFDLWAVCTKFLPKLKEKILARDGKLVIRPDSGNPVDIICGTEKTLTNINWSGKPSTEMHKKECEMKGVVELLWDVFGGTVNEQGYKVLDSHIGVIYGDSITLDRAREINERLKAKGFASTNWVAGVGSFTYQYNTRDTFGSAIKATYCEVEKDGVIEKRNIFKDPITDDGTKKSATGLLAVYDSPYGLLLREKATWEEVKNCAFVNIFENSKLKNEVTLAEIRERLKQ